MLLSHAVALAEARSYVAALADRAYNFEAAVEYERALLQLDWIHDNEVPPLTVVPAREPKALRGVAEAAIEELVDHGVDPLQVELVLAMLAAAHEQDRT